MVEYIKREDAIDKIIECVGEDKADFLEGVLHLVPTADVVERKSGEWLEMDSCMSVCSECGGLGCGSRFCPNCGAKMKGGGEW